MIHDILVAVAMLLVIEGVLPFIDPAAFRRALIRVAQFDDGQLRFAGLSVMIAGCVLLYVIRALS